MILIILPREQKIREGEKKNEIVAFGKMAKNILRHSSHEKTVSMKKTREFNYCLGKTQILLCIQWLLTCFTTGQKNVNGVIQGGKLRPIRQRERKEKKARIYARGKTFCALFVRGKNQSCQEPWQ